MTKPAIDSFRSAARGHAAALLTCAFTLCIAGSSACSSSDGSGGPESSAGAQSGGSTASGGAGGSSALGGAGGHALGGTGGSTSGGAAPSGGSAGFGVSGSTGISGSSAGGTTSTGGAGFGGAAPHGGGGNGGNGGGAAGAAHGGAEGSAGNGGSSGYQPCPTNGDPCKILPLGDSITWGIQYDGAYRVELFTKALAAQQKITFTGSLSNGPNMVGNTPFPKSNEGHSGWTIAQDAGLVPSPAFNTIPNIVLLMIGTNDVYAASGQSTMPDRLGSLMDKIFAAAPNALLVVAKITPLANAGSAGTIKTYNDAIPGLVQSRAAAGKHVVLADMNTGFTSAMLSSDGVHPNKSGYDFMGDAWYSVISSLLPK